MYKLALYKNEYALMRWLWPNKERNERKVNEGINTSRYETRHKVMKVCVYLTII